MTKPTIAITVFLLAIGAAAQAGDAFFPDLEPAQPVAGFHADAVYENASDHPIGGRFLHDESGFIVDLLRIESVPQAFFWVKTPPDGDRGEPHTCEHLMLGKGKRGRGVAMLEEMALGNSSAYTDQLVTAYHFNTAAGIETFYDLFDAKLNALLFPDFTDEEIRREVAHIGVVSDEAGNLSLEEKGTVYTEMVSNYEKPWAYLWDPVADLLYGKEHPLSRSSSGKPSAIRTMTARQMREFITEHYRLNNMGAIVAVPDDVPVEHCLTKLNSILTAAEESAGAGNDPSGKPAENNGITVRDLPPPTPSKSFGSISIFPYPSENSEAPGQLVFAYPPHLEYDLSEAMLIDLFWQSFTSGATSPLYRLLIDSKRRKIDYNVGYVYGYVSDDPGHPVYVVMGGIDNEKIKENDIGDLRDLILRELEKIYELKDGSGELENFNEEVLSRMSAREKQMAQALDSPPMFGFRRGRAGLWLRALERLEQAEGYRKSLVMKEHLANARKLLQNGTNIWKTYIDRWKMLKVEPYAVAIEPDPAMLAQARKEKQARLAGHVERFKESYRTDDSHAAIDLYKRDFDRKTAELDSLLSAQDFPGFTDNPPMSLDPDLDYQVINLENDIPLVASTFDNMTSATVGIALRLDVVPESLLAYVPFLPDLLASVGVVRDGEIITYDEMSTRLRNEVLNFGAYTDVGLSAERVELVLHGAGSDRDELMNLLDWMEAALYSPYHEEENLPRMVDLIDQQLQRQRNRMNGGEEGWVDSPADAYRYQNNPLVLAAHSFLTQVNCYQRLKFLLTDPGSKKDGKALAKFIDRLRKEGGDRSRSDLLALLDDPLKQPKSDHCKTVANKILSELKATLPAIPDATLSEDWQYLCRQIKEDLFTPPSEVLQTIESILTLVRRADNARLFMISNAKDREAALSRIESIISRLDDENKSKRRRYESRARIVERALSRHPELRKAPDAPRRGLRSTSDPNLNVTSADYVKPAYVGLVNPNTRNGVLIFTARDSEPYDTSRDAILDNLAGNIFSGGGAHGFFMQTWQSGLAYSNGIRYRPQSGQIRYYAERCPDVAETMRFVVSLAEDSLNKPSLTEYVVALNFGRTRAPDRYESRGMAIASDLDDGFPPERIAAHRRAVLAIRDEPGLFDEIMSRVRPTIGKVLIGMGQSLSDVHSGNYFLIGPEEQFESLERLIDSEEGETNIVRLHGRDFWLTP